MNRNTFWTFYSLISLVRGSSDSFYVLNFLDSPFYGSSDILLTLKFLELMFEGTSNTFYALNFLKLIIMTYYSPPVTPSDSPVMAAASSDAKNIAVAAISDGSSKRLNIPFEIIKKSNPYR